MNRAQSVGTLDCRAETGRRPPEQRRSRNATLDEAADAPLQALEHEILAPLVIDAMALALLAAVVLNCGLAEAQVGTIAPTTPLGVGPGGPAAVASSPDPSLPLGVTSPLGLSAGVPVGPVDIPLGATELGYPGETASAARPSPSAVSIGSGLGGRSSSPVSRAGIPLGATELSPGGLSSP